MTLPAQTDVVIVGAGLAGLSIACWLSRLASSHTSMPRICLLEEKDEVANDKTWCFWEQHSHPFHDVIAHRWPHWQVRHHYQSVESTDRACPYVMLTAEAMHQYAYHEIATQETFELLHGVQVNEVQQCQNAALCVTTNKGDIHAQLVIDTRLPPLSALSEPQGVWQVFHGVEISVRAHPYDTSRACLMDFQDGYDGINFIYCLPLDEQRLLVEWTCFHPHKDSPHCQTLLAPSVPAPLRSWLNAHIGDHWRVQRTERGCLPMMPISPPTFGPRYLSVGIRGGWMRASTGYMFSRCQQGAEDVARQVLTSHASGVWQLRPPKLQSQALRWMDVIFLRAIRQQPVKAPGWFLQLFSNTSPKQQRRFLGDQAHLSDQLAIMRALPPGPFLSAAMHSLSIVPDRCKR